MVHLAGACGYVLGRSSRRKVFEQELELLRRDLREMGYNGRTGNAAADTLIAGWTPDALLQE